MGVRINAWYRHGDNVGHASLEIDGVYMSWWPDGSNPTKLAIIKAMIGGPGTAPTYQDDTQSSPHFADFGVA
jgi:hypothetical protein